MKDERGPDEVSRPMSGGDVEFDMIAYAVVIPTAGSEGEEELPFVGAEGRLPVFAKRAAALDFRDGLRRMGHKKARVVRTTILASWMKGGRS